MSKKKRKMHPDFVNYMKVIATHANYRDMPEPYKENGQVRWVVSGNSALGIERAKWWDQKVSQMKLKNRAEVARKIHPKELNGMKPCQICGRRMSIFYVYPATLTLKEINKNAATHFKQYGETIYELFDSLDKKYGNHVLEILKASFDVPKHIQGSKDSYLDFITEQRTNSLSPGVMSNAPDRFDGFHSYNACCRSREDTGRHKPNLALYTQDRRAYENWSEGNWNVSNRLMGEFRRLKKLYPCPACGKIEKMSADHIGPISLGFTHQPRFNALCKSCNSKKNKRLTFNDVKELIREEQKGEKVVSWHSKYVWNSLKGRIRNDNDAKKLSRIMHNHLHNVLLLLSVINSKGYKRFLLNLLHPEYSYVDYRLAEDFNPFDPTTIKMKEKPLSSKNKEKNAKRYIRISFESLEDYQKKKNRKSLIVNDQKVDNLTRELMDQLKLNRNKKAHETLKVIIKRMSEIAIRDFS